MENKERPNILLIMTDQQRGDCLGIEGSVVETPYLDNIAKDGFHFTSAFSACPVCIPARRTLMTGKKASSHGVFCNYPTRLEGTTLPEALSKAGYQTHLVGKLHLHPFRKLYGFMSADMADNPVREDSDGDYGIWLRRHFPDIPQVGQAHGCDQNGWVSRPWHLDERYHFTNWTTDKAIEFLDRKDPTTPFFLKVSYHQPHQPCCPPQYFWDKYMSREIDEPFVGDWANYYEEAQIGHPVSSWITKIPKAQMRQYRAGYYGCVEHIDNQIGRLLKRVPKNTVIMFISDHGEMLGDHQWLRKQNAYEPSIRVPMLIQLPKEMKIEQKKKINELAEIMDVMPTLLDIAGVEIPESVDGKSLLPYLKGEATTPLRDYIHGECSSRGDAPFSPPTGQQFIRDKNYKYIWYPATGEEHFFDIKNDPKEMKNLSNTPEFAETIEEYRRILVGELKERVEGFVQDGKLKALGVAPPPTLPEFR